MKQLKVSKGIVFEVEEKLFKTNILFMIGMPTEDANQVLKKFGINDRIQDKNDSTLGQLVIDNGGIWNIVYVKYQNDISCIVHELYHLVTRILYRKGMVSQPNVDDLYLGDETGAYMIEYYFREVIKQINKTKQKGWKTFKQMYEV